MIREQAHFCRTVKVWANDQKWNENQTKKAYPERYDINGTDGKKEEQWKKNERNWMEHENVLRTCAIKREPERSVCVWVYVKPIFACE